MELKLNFNNMGKKNLISFNRTFMELKSWHYFNLIRFGSFNRTFMELK